MASPRRGIHTAVIRADISTVSQVIRQYRFANAFHPFHGFSMMSCEHIAVMNTSGIYLVGAREPGIAHGMGLKTRATFEEALEDAKKKYVVERPNILALPQTFTTATTPRPIIPAAADRGILRKAFAPK